MNRTLNFFSRKRDAILLYTLFLSLSGAQLSAETIPHKNIPQQKSTHEKLPGSCGGGAYWCAYKHDNGKVTASNTCISASCSFSAFPFGCFLTYSESESAHRYCGNERMYVDGIGYVTPNWIELKEPVGGCNGPGSC